jgi:HlyD family secretion protein
MRSLRLNEAVGFVMVGLLVLGTFGWAVRAELSGAVIASGQAAVRDVSKAVQHVEGGTIRELFVTEGSPVKAAMVVARLDDTQIRAKLAIVEGQLAELAAEQARLEAERDGRDDFAVFDTLSEHVAPGTMQRAIEGQRKHMISIRETIAKKKEQLREQIAQIEAAIGGNEAKLAATRKQITLAEAELGVLQSLMDRGLTTRNRIFAMERELVMLRGEAEDLGAKIAGHRGQVAETRIKLLELDDQRRAEVTGRLSEIRPKIADLYEQRSFELFRLNNTQIVAPISGRVHDLRIHTVGGVIAPGDTLMTVVPSDDALVFRVRVRPEEIDRVYAGQPARLRLTAFNARTTPEIEGKVAVVGADQLVDQATGVAYFRVDIEVEPEAFAGIDRDKIRPGLPAEAFITTDPQTVMTYLLRPLLDHFAKAMRTS